MKKRKLTPQHKKILREMHAELRKGIASASSMSNAEDVAARLIEVRDALSQEIEILTKGKGPLFVIPVSEAVSS